MPARVCQHACHISYVSRPALCLQWEHEWSTLRASNWWPSLRLLPCRAGADITPTILVPVEGDLGPDSNPGSEWGPDAGANDPCPELVALLR